MKITIKGNPKEIAELAAILQARQTAQSEKADPQGEAAGQGLCKEIADAISTLNAKAVQNAPQRLADEQKIETLANAVQKVLEKAIEKDTPQGEAAKPGIPFAHFKPRLEELIKRTKEANSGE